MNADYPGAIVVEAANFGYGTPNRPVTWCFHTPEEPADSYPSTPDYLATTDRDASYTYFVSSWLALVFQLVPESEGAYAHGLEGKPEPPWSDGSNLNLQSFSLAFEGHAATIHQTMPRGCPQWVAGVNLVAHRTKALGLNLDWAFQHKQVSIYRGDCGSWDQAAFIADVKTKMEEDMALTTEDEKWIKEQIEAAQPWTTKDKNWIVAKIEAARPLTNEDKVWFKEKVESAIRRIQEMHDVTRGSGATGLSVAQVKQAVKDALKEGTE